jgi:hypothetical protein
MSTISLFCILAGVSSVVAIVAALRWYISRKVRDEKAALVRTRLAQLHEPELGAYESDRIDRFLSAVNASRMTRRAPASSAGSVGQKDKSHDDAVYIKNGMAFDRE